MELGFEEPTEEGRGRRTVETMVVIENSRAHLKISTGKTC
jgi:hypothetical protein